jgi:hypothetical protein
LKYIVAVAADSPALVFLCLQALAAEKAAAAHEREMEVARLRALQEKVQDTRSAEDELRAKRYQVSAANKLETI